MPAQKPADPLQLKLSLIEINLVLEALGQMPFARVHELIGSIQRQAHGQLQAATGGTATTSPQPRKTR